MDSTHPLTDRPVLLTGATGFVGSHVYPALRAAGLRVRCASRDPEAASRRMPDRDWVRLDVERPASFEAVEGCRAVVYLVHQMGGGSDYPEREARAATALRQACEAAGVERLVYLGGVEPSGARSPHLASRLRTGELLRAGKVPAIELRAGMVIGAGSASWQIVRDLAARLPAMILPKWLKNRSSPVSLDDVVQSILWGLLGAPAKSEWYDVAGPELITHRDLIRSVARTLGKRTPMLEVPIVTPALSSYWIALVTRTGLELARELVEGLQTDLVPTDQTVWRHMGDRSPMDLAEAVRNALADEAAPSLPTEATAARMAALGRSFSRKEAA